MMIIRWKRLSLFMVLFAVTSGIFYGFYFLKKMIDRARWDAERYRIFQKKYVDRCDRSTTTKFILIHEPRSWPFDTEIIDKERLQSVDCPNTNCIFTNNKNLLKHVHEFDALVFESSRDFNRQNVPETRSPHQIYISASKECSNEIWHDLDLYRDYFNMTFSYRLDSDIQWIYGNVEYKLAGHKVAPAIKVNWKQPEEDFQDDEMFEMVKRKTKSAAWFVSHCTTLSRREKLVESLQKFIDVDVYGHCGPLTCEINSAHCDQMLNSTYRFYMALENTLCLDYLTEKVFLNMQQLVIPVIYSGAELSRFLPPRSYIDANDFESVEDLANHLKFLTQNPEEYVKYFWWKQHYKIVPQIEITSDHLCDICQKLNEPHISTKRQVYRDIKKWYMDGSSLDPKIEF